jgi:hypothetical protein
MPEREEPNGVWNTASLFSGEAAPPPPSSASPPPSSAPPPPSSAPLFPPAAPLLPPPAAPLLPPPAAPPSRSGGGRRPLIVGAVVALVLIAVATGLVLGLRGKPEARAGSIGDQPVPVATTLPAEPATPETTAPTEAATTDDSTSEDSALTELEQLSDEGRSQVSFHGQYAAQLASKYPGLVDPLQTTATGSHTFGAADILDEYQGLHDAHGGIEHPVILLKSTDYGKRQMIGTHFLWVTFAVGGFPDSQSVQDWCDDQFAALDAEQRKNQCAVRRLEPGR